MKKLKVAVIGTGGMGKNHVRIFSKLANLAAVVDLNEQSGREVAAANKTKYFRTCDEMLAQTDVDAVSIATPTKSHEEISIKCLKAGKAVLLEKPIATDVVQARNIINTAKKYKSILMIGHIERYNPAIIKLKKLADKNYFGRIVNIGAIRVGVSPPKIPNSDVLLDLGIHDIDICNYVLNEKPKHVSVMRDKVFKKTGADAAVVILKYKQTIGTLQTNWISPTKIRKLYLTGLKRSAELDYINQTLSILERQEIVDFTKDYRTFMAASGVVEKTIKIVKQEPLEVEIKHFLEIARKGQIEDSQYAVDALEAVIVKEI